MTRHAGPILVLLTLLAMAGVRWMSARRAEELVAGEAHARATIGTLAASARMTLARGEQSTGLRGPFPPAAGGLAPMPELGNAEVSYAHDGTYMYGYASHPHRDTQTEDIVPGFVLRAWPLDFGVTGDLEYQVGDDGALWEGQNRNGRSGTNYGFPPPFPEPGVGVEAGTTWWPVGSPPHR